MFVDSHCHLSFPELHDLARVLPDDSVLISGGSQDYRGRSDSNILEARMYDAKTGDMRKVADPLVGRNYHSGSLLLPDGRVVFGATVELEELESGETVTYQIVGEDEADLKHGLINISSPIARALIGKEEGDTAEVQAPGGVKHYEVIGVKYI